MNDHEQVCNTSYSSENEHSAKPKKPIYEVPVWKKANLTLEEAAAYFGIGINKLRDLTNSENCTFVLWVGSKRLIKRKVMETYLEKIYSI